MALLSIIIGIAGIALLWSAYKPTMAGGTRTAITTHDGLRQLRTGIARSVIGAALLLIGSLIGDQPLRIAPYLYAIGLGLGVCFLVYIQIRLRTLSPSPTPSTEITP